MTDFADFDDLLTDSASTLGDNSNEVGFNAEGGYQKNNSNTNGFAGNIDDDDWSLLPSSLTRIIIYV